MQQPKAVPLRDAIKVEDTWDLTKLFRSDAAWERSYKKLENRIPAFEGFRGALGRSPQDLRACLEFEGEFEMRLERLAVYAFLKNSQDVTQVAYQGMVARHAHLATQAAEVSSFITPELLAIPPRKLAKLMAHPLLAEYRFLMKKRLRNRAHTLSEKEERLLAMFGEVARSAPAIFEQLNDADMSFGFVTDDSGAEVALTHNSYYSLLKSPDRTVRKQVFTAYYKEYEAHAHTLAATLRANVLQDVYHAKARHHPSAVESALFPDNIPLSIYDNLVETVHANLDAVHNFMDVRRRVLRTKKLHEYDNYVPVVKAPSLKISYGEAVDTVCEALTPLGAGYVEYLRHGLLDGRWVDRYENQGKCSGGFSYGTYGAPPYILMNYRDDALYCMFHLAHEAGHSMHNYLSAKHQPYHYSEYTTLVAEVAAIFNEQLLGRHLIRRAETRQEKARFIEQEINGIHGKIISQTMFAEFERSIHATVEAGQPLTLDVFRAQYRALLELYSGPSFVVDDALELEGLRIPHFYRAFYVYQYATGISAAIALSEMVVNGGKKERERYLNFLKSGGSKFPLDLLKDAGVDLTGPEPVEAAMNRFAVLVDELEQLI